MPDLIDPTESFQVFFIHPNPDAFGSRFELFSRTLCQKILEDTTISSSFPESSGCESEEFIINPNSRTFACCLFNRGT